MPEQLEPIEGQDVPYLREQNQKLETAIAASGELQARIATLKNPALTPEQVVSMVDSWNADHQVFAGAYVEKVFDSPSGMKLIIRMDKEGNIQLSSKLYHE